MTAAELLRGLAERTVHAPVPLGTGRYHYVHTSGAHLNTKHFLRRSGESTVPGSIEPFERRQWIAADGSMRLVVTSEGQLVPPSGDYPPGEPAVPFVSAADERSLAVELRKLTTEETTPAVVKALRQVWLMQVVPPALQRLLLLRLAECTDLSPDTSRREFAGRSAVAVTCLDQTRHFQHLLAFDRDTGEVIGAETTALEGARVPVPVPAVTSSTVWLTSEYRETLD